MSQKPARITGLLVLIAGLGLAGSAILKTHVAWDPVRSIAVDTNGTIWSFIAGMILALAGSIMTITSLFD